jgi:hypothetical protein
MESSFVRTRTIQLKKTKQKEKQATEQAVVIRAYLH